LLKIDKFYSELPWLAGPRRQFSELLAQGRCPSALLLHGRAGTGRRHLALWLAEEMLGFSAEQLCADADELGHPDLFVVEPLEDKNTIGIDQIRELIEFLALTSHGNSGRVALVWPAEAMTANAANSLLKTLEEPPGNAVVLLITESVSRLPATIVSRCQRLRIPVPETTEALQWLEASAPGVDFGRLLDFAGGAPLAALALHEAEFAAAARQFAADLQNLTARRGSPPEIARRWAKNADIALQWLYWALARQIRAGLTDEAGPPQDRVQPDSIQAAFRQMAQIRELRRLIKGGINAELSIAGLLMDWYGGLGQP
jgi:DNA polymerase-3 subunit delta'